MSIKCPVCDSDKKNQLIKLCGNMKIMGPNFPVAETNMVECSNCGCVYVDMEATQKDFNFYYKKIAKCMSYYQAFGDEIAHEYYTHIYDSIKNHMNKDSQILDIGCGYGDFSKYLMNLGYKNVTAMDISDECYEAAKNAGVNILHTEVFLEDESLKNKFDMIVFNHTLEHILDVKRALENVKSMLKPNGILYLEYPDASRYCDVDFAPFFFYTYEHTFHISEDTMRNMANSYGLKLLESETYMKCRSFYSIYGIYQNGGEILGVKYSSKDKDSVLKYDEFCKNKLKPIIKEFENSQEELILWGIGASTAQLLNENFDNCNVIQLIDSNTSRQGVEFKIADKTLSIMDPSEIKNKEATILVLPIMYANSIIKQIKDMGFENKIATLG